MNDRLEITLNKHVAEVMLNRPARLNALDLELFHALDKTARSLEKETSLRAVVLYGAGDNFCAGIDLGLFEDGGAGIGAALLDPVEGSPANLFQRAAYCWRELPVPVICALEGVAYGAGFQVAMGADLRYAAPDTRMSIMESKWGLIPDMAISTTLRHILPPDRIKELAWTARVFDAAEALGLGLVTAVEEDPLAVARHMAGALSKKSPDAIRGIKHLVNAAWSLSREKSLALEAQLQLRLLGKENQAEAVRANLEKRDPEFVD